MTIHLRKDAFLIFSNWITEQKKQKGIQITKKSEILKYTVYSCKLCWFFEKKLSLIKRFGYPGKPWAVINYVIKYIGCFKNLKM